MRWSKIKAQLRKKARTDRGLLIAIYKSPQTVRSPTPKAYFGTPDMCAIRLKCSKKVHRLQDYIE